MLALWISLGVVGGYISTSLFFLRFPQIFHKKKKQNFKCRHISHRGGAGENLENTMSAFKHAVRHGTEMLEIDLQLTSDGEVVVSHDDNLTRLTGQDICISQCKYADLPPLLETLDVTFTDGATVSCSNGDRQIPLLRTLFEEFPDTPMNIDVKTHNSVLIDKTIDLIRQYKRENLVVIGHFSDETVLEIHEKAPDLHLLFSIKRCLMLVVFFYTGLLPFIPLKEEFLEIPLPRIILRNSNAFLNYRWLIRMSDWLIIRPCLFRHLQRRGVQVYLFVINEPADFDVCLNKLKVDGVMTDYPSKLQSFLEIDSTEQHEDQPILTNR